MTDTLRHLVANYGADLAVAVLAPAWWFAALWLLLVADDGPAGG
jgi:hypothetical protein